MPGKKSVDQCLTWLQSIAAGDDLLAQINAQLCLSVIKEQQAKIDLMGMQIGLLKKQTNVLKEDKGEQLSFLSET